MYVQMIQVTFLCFEMMQNLITRDDIIAYAEEGGDFAQLKEVDSFMEVNKRMYCARSRVRVRLRVNRVSFFSILPCAA